MAWHYVTSLLGATPYGKHTGTIYIGPAIYLFIYLLSHADLLAGHEGGTQSLNFTPEMESRVLGHVDHGVHGGYLMNNGKGGVWELEA